MNTRARYVKVTQDFDPHSFDGAIVVCHSLADGKYFTEKGWDEGDPEGTKVIEIQTDFRNPADDAALDKILGQLGIDIYSGEQEDTLPDVICQRPEVRQALEAAGYDSVRTESIVVANSQFDGVILWKPETFQIVPQPTDIRDFSIDYTLDGNLNLMVNTAAGAQKYVKWDWQEDMDYRAIKSALWEAFKGLDGFSLFKPSAIRAESDSIIIGKNVTFTEEGVTSAEAIWQLTTPLLYHAGHHLLSERKVVFQPLELKPIQVMAHR